MPANIDVVTATTPTTPLFDELLFTGDGGETIINMGSHAIVDEVTTVGTIANTHSSVSSVEQEVGSTDSTPPILPPFVQSASFTQEDHLSSDTPPSYCEIAEYAIEVNRSRSPSPLETPPLAFKNALPDPYCGRHPPRYVFDDYPQAGLHMRSHICGYSLEEKSGLTLSTLLDASSLANLTFDEDHGVSEAVLQYTQMLHAGFVVAI